MNKIIFSLLLFIAATTSAQTISFIDNDWNKARAEAKQANKYLFVDAYTDWCYWCKVMDKETFPNAQVVHFMNTNFVSLKLEQEHNYGVNVAMKYHVDGFPSFLVFAPDGKLVRKLMGYMEAKPFMETLKMTLNETDFPPLTGISEKVDLKFPDFYKKSFSGKNKRVMPEAKVVNAFLSKQKDLTSEINYSVMVRFASLLSEKNQTALFENKDKLEKLYGKGELNDAVSSIENKLLTNAIKEKSEIGLQTAIDFNKKYGEGDAEMTQNLFRINYYKGTADWKKMAEQVDKFITQKGHPGGYINDWSWTVYEKCDDAEIVKKAVEWMYPVVEAKSEYATMDTYAALLYKAKRFHEAQAYAEKAIDLGKAAGEKTDETEKLLKKIEAEK